MDRTTLFVDPKLKDRIHTPLPCTVPNKYPEKTCLGEEKITQGLPLQHQVGQLQTHFGRETVPSDPQGAQVSEQMDRVIVSRHRVSKTTLDKHSIGDFHPKNGELSNSHLGSSL